MDSCSLSTTTTPHPYSSGWPLCPDKPLSFHLECPPGLYFELGQLLSTVICVALRAAAAFQGNILHLDITSGNVLLAWDGTAKVADIGLARFTKTVGTYASCLGTYEWASPELLMGRRCSKASDVYSFGEQNPMCSDKAVAQSLEPTHLLPPNFQQLHLPAGVLLWELASAEQPRRGQMRDLRSVQMRCLV